MTEYVHAERPIKEIIDAVIEAGGRSLKLCYQCGTCRGVCPWNIGESFFVREILRLTQLGLAEFEGEEAWMCTTCRNCVIRCPRGVQIIDIMRAIRRLLSESGSIPKTLRSVITSVQNDGNPWHQARSQRSEWSEGLGLKRFEQGTDLLYFTCCTQAYDSRNRKVARAIAKLLQTTGANFGVLDDAVVCCGESIRKIGAEDLFEELARENLQAFKSVGARKILASSPHCYYALKNDYSQYDGILEVRHVTEHLLEQVRKGALRFEKPIDKRVVYHDPCYLGRYSGIYDPPREILSSIPKLELIELSQCRDDSLCCGGGGGRVWMETKKGERFSDLRVQQALEAGAEVIATSCPYCIINLEDSVLGAGLEQTLEVKDVCELALESVLQEA